MKPKLIFWIDSNFYYFGLAKSLQETLDCELYSVIETTDKPKKFFEEQKIVNFKKVWFFYDYVKNILLSPQCKSRGLFNNDNIQMLLNNPNKYFTKLNGNKLWHLALLERWLQMNVDRV